MTGQTGANTCSIDYDAVFEERTTMTQAAGNMRFNTIEL
jgi:hypothetical protein